MNLIEEFKDIISECIKKKDFYNADRMKHIYREYRRENNIFEVNGNVVQQTGSNDEVMTVFSVEFDGTHHATDKEIEQGYRDE